MDKIAQRRSILNKIKEKTNIGGIAAEKFFNPEFERVMDKLRETDSNLRSIAMGESIDGGDPGNDNVSLKQLLKEADANFNRREYITCVAFLGRFHKKLSDIIDVINTLDLDVNKVHKDFLFKELGDEQKQILRDMNKRFANKISKESFITNAGIMDFLHNIGTSRGRALAAWEKRYPKQVKKLKKDTNLLLKKSESILSSLLSDFDRLAQYRAKRQVDDYMKTAFKFKALFNNYHSLFNSYYNENVKSFLANDDFLNPPEPEQKKIDVETNSPTNIYDKQKTLISNDGEEEKSLKNDYTMHDIDKPNNFVPQWIDVTYDKNGNKINVFNDKKENNYIPIQDDVTNDVEYDNEKEQTESELIKQLIPSGLENLDEEIPKTSEDVDTDADTVPPDTAKSAHMNFYYQMQSLSNESPILMAKHILKYAKKIESTDSVLSKKLYKIYNQIVGE